MMAISKRLRHEIMRRDNNTCQYCGGTAPEVRLTIDHVTPVTLGGTDLPSNLVTACADCNAGKSATPPDAPLVESVSQSALRWTSAMAAAATQMAAEDAEFQVYLGAWENAWQPRYMPTGYAQSVRSMYDSGLPEEQLVDAVHITFAARAVDSRFAYFCGVAWKKIRKLQELAQHHLDVETQWPTPEADPYWDDIFTDDVEPYVETARAVASTRQDGDEIALRDFLNKMFTGGSDGT